MTTPTTFVPLTEVSTALGRPLSTAEEGRAGQLIRQLIRLLERRWNRDLLPRTITNERHIVRHDGTVVLHRGPGATVTAVRTASGLPAGSTPWGLTPGSEVYVDYTTAGITDADDVVGVIVAAVASALRADAEQAATTSTGAAGPVKSFTVEGLSISYGDASSTASSSSSSSSGSDPLVVGSLKGLGRLRRPVLL